MFPSRWRCAVSVARVWLSYTARILGGHGDLHARGYCDGQTSTALRESREEKFVRWFLVNGPIRIVTHGPIVSSDDDSFCHIVNSFSSEMWAKGALASAGGAGQQQGCGLEKGND